MFWKRAVCITLMGAALVWTCPQVRAQCEGDFDGDNRVSVNELIKAVGNALSGCEPAVSILGVFEGPGLETLLGCTDPGDDGTFEIANIAFEVTEQTGSLYEATLSLTDARGQPLSLEVKGTVDSQGVTEGAAFLQGIPVPAGLFTGRVVGDILAVSVKINDPTCQSVASSFIGTRS